ncbi:MAG: hypothetical protein ACFWTQ_05120 [Lactococcus sp.]|jgi:hypothetical protein
MREDKQQEVKLCFLFVYEDMSGQTNSKTLMFFCLSAKI